MFCSFGKDCQLESNVYENSAPFKGRQKADLKAGLNFYF